MLLFAANELLNPCSAFIDLLSLPVEGRGSIESANLIAKSLYINISSRTHNFRTFSREKNVPNSGCLETRLISHCYAI